MMLNNALNLLRNRFDTPQRPQTGAIDPHSGGPIARDYLGTRDDLSSAGIIGSKINAESGHAYITQERPSVHIVERLELPRNYDRNGNLILGSGTNSVNISLARNHQLPEDHANAYVAMKTFVGYEQAALEYANHQALGDNPRFVKALDVAHVTSDECSYMFMERMTGGDGKAHLEQIFRERALRPDEKKELMLDAIHGYLSCLKAMHDKGFKHGDIDIKNFFHDADSHRVAIGDFGRSRQANPAQQIDEAKELGMMFNRDIRPEALRARVDTKDLDNIIGVLYGSHPDPRVKEDPIGILLNWAQIQPNYLIQ
ncbi:protein kinase [Pseudomonas asuensis]